MTYNVRAEEPVNVSETSEAEHDLAFTGTPPSGSAEVGSSAMAKKVDAAEKRKRDKALAKDKQIAAKAPPPPAPTKLTTRAQHGTARAKESMQNLKSQLGAARAAKVPVTVGKTTEVVHEFLRTECEAAVKKVTVAEAKKVCRVSKSSFGHLLTII